MDNQKPGLSRPRETESPKGRKSQAPRPQSPPAAKRPRTDQEVDSLGSPSNPIRVDSTSSNDSVQIIDPPQQGPGPAPPVKAECEESFPTVNLDCMVAPSTTSSSSGSSVDSGEWDLRPGVHPTNKQPWHGQDLEPRSSDKDGN